MRTISGFVYDDVDGDANIIEAGTQFVAGATVRIYRDVNTNNTIDAADNGLVGTATTDAAGAYSISGLAAGRYWVAVDSKTINPSNVYNSGSGLGDVWAEQTYAVDGATSAGFTGGAGALFSGRNAAQSDNAAALLTSEHVVRADATAGNVTGSNFGFSFNAVTNSLAGDAQDDDGSNARTVQGSLRQFIQNANAIAGANTMRFVPVVAASQSSGADNWWRIDVSTALPQITGADTVIDGTAWDYLNPVSQRNTNTGSIGAGGFVGTGADGVTGTGDERPTACCQPDRTSRARCGSSSRTRTPRRAPTRCGSCRRSPAASTTFSDDGNYTNDGGDDWWRIAVTAAALPPITGANTTIDGTAYDKRDGVAVLDTNQGLLGTGGSVGTGADGRAGTGDESALGQVARPELEIRNNAAPLTSIGIGLDVNGANAVIQDLAILGFGTGVPPGAPIGNIVVRNVAGTRDPKQRDRHWRARLRRPGRGRARRRFRCARRLWRQRHHSEQPDRLQWVCRRSRVLVRRQLADPG